MKSFDLIPFGVREWSECEKVLKAHIIKELTEQTEEYILNVNEEEFINFLVEKNRLNQINIGKEPCNIEEPKTENHYIPSSYPLINSREVHYIRVFYPFSGDYWLLGIQPSVCSFHISGGQKREVIFNSKCTEVSIEIKLDKLDKKEFQKELKSAYDINFNPFNVCNINKHVEEFNNNLESFIRSKFHELKEKYLKKANFMEAIKVTVNPDIPQTFSVPIIKKNVYKPSLGATRDFKSQPTLDKNTYEHILQVLRGIGRSFEQKPKNYIGKDEEGIRDALLPTLEILYTGCTTTGETFNYSGKTDLLIKHSDGTNLFVGECKFWHGQKQLEKAIDQLLSYLTWHDTKTALLIFVREDNITPILKKITETCKSHKNYLKFVKSATEYSFSFKFHLPGDKDRTIFLEVIVFHFNKLSTNEDSKLER